MSTPGKSKVIISNDSIGNKPSKNATGKTSGAAYTTNSDETKDVKADDVTSGMS